MMSALPFKVKAIFDYNSPHEDDLSFPTGQIINVTEEEDADWYVGEYTESSGEKRSGLFPRNFVEKYEPEAPPRPTRARPKKEAAPPVTADPISEDTAIEPTTAPAPPETASSKPVETPKSPPAAITSPPFKAAEPKPEPTRAAVASKSPPPPVAEKPSSFKDRIAAFNKPQAAPLAPGKLGGSSFVKKPFVAPPPARDAYVPPAPREHTVAKVYIRDEDPEIKQRLAEDQENAERAGFTTTEGDAEAEDEPKSTSLKDRIALLQKQQQEQAARRADSSHKEKPKKPQKKRTESSEHIATAPSGAIEDEAVPHTAEGALRDSIDEPRPPPVRRISRDDRPPIADTISDGNEADQSAAGETTEDGGASSTEVEEQEERRPSKQSTLSRTSTTLSREATSIPKEPVHAEREEEDGDARDEDEESEESEDEETRRKRELRERMAKMSGGMGMPGMFAMPSAVPAPKKKSSGQSEARASREPDGPMSPPVPTQRVPMVPIPGMPRMQSPPVTEEPEVMKEPEEDNASIEEGEPEEVPDVEDLQARPSARAPPPPPPDSQDRIISPTAAPSQRGIPPPVPSGRPLPPAPSGSSAPLPPPRAPPAKAQESGDEDEEEDEEEDDDGTPILAQAARRASVEIAARGPPSIPPARPEGPRSPPAAHDKRRSYMETIPPPTSQADKRLSRGPPPIPGTIPAMPPIPTTEARPPPPPPPTAAPPTRKGTTHESMGSPIPGSGSVAESDYEGDYDTDIASGADHKNALNQVQEREPSIDESTLSEEPLARSPTIGSPPIPGAVQRAPPPPPPHTAPQSKNSMDLPRAPPPLPPVRSVNSSDDYDPYSYNAPRHGIASPPLTDEPIQASDPALYGVTSRSTAPQVIIAPTSPTERGPPPPPPTGAPSQPSREVLRPSMEASRRSMNLSRVSMDQSRPSMEQGQMAQDVDLAQTSQWWTQPNTPPPVFQKRNDILCEYEENTTSKRGGRTTVSRDVYILFADYSQTVITAQYDAKNTSDVILEQRHEPSPPRLRQDQLEEAYGNLGTAIAASAPKSTNHVVGDGTAQALILETLSGRPSALLPVGSRAYGALVYSNMANATVTQLDEIRAGDIISFRNAKFSGKHGAMHAKYSEDVGKPEHVGIVVEWDGTKKKVRALEQGRENKKVKVESFRVGDLRSGEVKVWRVMSRSWVGWDK